MAYLPFTSRKGAARPGREELKRTALSHYFRGNRFFESKLWDKASEEWRHASQLWRPQDGAAGRRTARYLRLRAVLILLFTVLVVHQALYAFFPRDPMELVLLSANQQLQSRSWWERWLDTGRPQAGDDHKITVREWWSRFKQRMRGSGREEVARQGGIRPRISERWADLLRRYGRWGPFVSWDLDYSVISGNGLSRLGEYDTAVKILEKSISEVSEREKLADLYQSLANAHYYRGYQLQPDGTAQYDLPQVGKAARAYEKSLKNKPRPLSYGNLGWMYFLMGDYDRSERFSKRALDMNANLHYVRLNLGLVYLVQGKHRRSFETYYDVLRRNPPDEVYLGGITDLREIVREYPGRYSFAYLMVGVLSLKKGDLATAREALTRYLAGPAQGRYWKELAGQLLEQMAMENLER
ncbi:MAG: tetratricopeptide repeat protein [SAR324 cluster bacterium]|nr:tetratricopeptide repeat protein [SAR324 cluster bacterium]